MLEITYRPTASLIPYAQNSRTHSQEQVEQIAASIKEFGFTAPILLGADGVIIAGHGRLMAAVLLALDEVPTITLGHLDEAQRRAYVIADNQLALNAAWDFGLLKTEVQKLLAVEFDVDVLGFEVGFLDRLLGEVDERTLMADAADEDFDDEERPAVTIRGDVWLCGSHRVMCGDSRDLEDVGQLMRGRTALLLHSDPPYGMGKDFANDNLTGERLDAFNLSWWMAWRPYLEKNASAYIWGNAPDLWRLWLVAGLGASEEMTLQNELVWHKASATGMRSADMVQYPRATERALYFQLGRQYLGNVNQSEFPAAWRPLLEYLQGEANGAGLTPARLREVVGKSGMWSHWFTPSQFTRIPERHYSALRDACPGYFLRPWVDINAEWQRVKGAARDAWRGQGTRSYFDNTHDAMADVWEFPPVRGGERMGHDTPKPVELMERVMRSSLPAGGVCAEPFGGSGSTLLAAERTDRVCYCMELAPRWADTIVTRWQDATGLEAVHERSGVGYNVLARQRGAIE